MTRSATNPSGPPGFPDNAGSWWPDLYSFSVLLLVEAEVCGRKSPSSTVNAFIDELTTERGFSVNTVAAYRNDLSQFAEYPLRRPGR